MAGRPPGVASTIPQFILLLSYLLDLKNVILTLLLEEDGGDYNMVTNNNNNAR
jgi:hypothetical protein